VQEEDDDFARIRARQIAASAAMVEIERLNHDHLISFPVYNRLQAEVQQRLEEQQREAVSLYKDHGERIDRETREARKRLAVAERSAIEQSMHSGLISARTARDMIGETDKLVESLDTGEQDESKLSSAPAAQDAAPPSAQP
jgi:hypothetical protein